MKKLYFLVVVLFVVGSVKGQVIDFPDQNLKNKLLEANAFNYIAVNLQSISVKIDTNNDGEIQISEAINIIFLDLTNTNSENNNITDITGITNFVNLETLIIGSQPLTTIDLIGFNFLKELDLEYSPLTTVDLSPLSQLETFRCTNSQLSAINFSGVSNLKFLDCAASFLTTIDLSSCPLLEELYCHQNQIASLDLSSNPLLKRIHCYANQLTSLNLNGILGYEQMYCDENLLTHLDLSNTYPLQMENFGAQLGISLNPLVSINIKNGRTDYIPIDNIYTLEYICSDESEMIPIQNSIDMLGYTNCVLNSYCSFIPGGTSYGINVSNSIDTNNNGCDTLDTNFPNLKYNITNGMQTGSFMSDEEGSYSIPVSAGTHTIIAVLENPTFFNISPSTVEVIFPETTSPFTQNFCITPNGVHPDLEIAILPTTPARPGFDADYIISIKNKGNIQQSCTVSFAYEDAVLDYIISNPAFTTQTTGSLTWNFANLEPFETREINVTLNVNSPMETPAINGDDVLNYTATITSDQADELPLDNTFTLPQIVVNSFDPNDKTCLEGTSITPDMIGKYVHYMIRFENTGTFAAENIVVKDMIDTAKFDVSSLVALNGSHPYVTRITGNKVEFIFENINLPFEDANNDGYVVFKIKTLPTLALGDSFSNTASIYFDFNYPIVTEPAVTTFAELGTKDFDFNNYFTLYPNPANGVLNITSKQNIELQSISIYNVLGQMVVSVPNAKGVNGVDVSNLSNGNYFIKVVSDKGTSNAKFIKQ